MSKRKIVINALLGSLCCFVFLSALHAAADTSGGSANSTKCLAVGEIEERYTADEGCSYQITTRVCCPNGLWSEWGERCPLAPRYSKERLNLRCSGRYGGFKQGINFCYGGRPTVTLPYPPCSEINICKDKTEGYKCYQSYSPKPADMATLLDNYIRQGNNIQRYNPTEGCGIEVIDVTYNTVIECADGSVIGDNSGTSGGRSSTQAEVYNWISGSSFDIDVITCEVQTLPY